MKTSVIIPAYGLCPHLEVVLAAIFGGTLQPDEVVISHSGTDNPQTQLKGKYPKARWLHSDSRLFAGAARNAGAKIATGDIYAFCDSDVVPCNTWLNDISGTLENDSELLIVGAVDMHRTGGYWGMSNWICEFSEQAPWRPKGQQTGGASCNMALTANNFQEIGGFPEYLTPGEDTMFLALGRELGLKQTFFPEIRVGHINNEGFMAFARHQFAIGQAFAVTRQDQDLPGKVFIRIPFLTPLLWGPKCLLVIARAFLAGGRGLRQGIILTPGILSGGLIFTIGACFKVLRKQA